MPAVIRAFTTRVVMEARWTLTDLLGFVESWSAVQEFMTAEGRRPLAPVRDDLAALWGGRDETRAVRWPLFFRIGRVAP